MVGFGSAIRGATETRANSSGNPASADSAARRARVAARSSVRSSIAPRPSGAVRVRSPGTSVRGGMMTMRRAAIENASNSLVLTSGAPVVSFPISLPVQRCHSSISSARSSSRNAAKVGSVSPYRSTSAGCTSSKVSLSRTRSGSPSISPCMRSK